MNTFGTVKLVAGNRLIFGNNETVSPRNMVLKIEDGVVYFATNYDQYIAQVDAEDYFNLALWAYRVVFCNGNLDKGVLSFYRGYENKSLAAAILQTKKGQKIRYRDGNHLNCCKSNLYIAGQEA